MSENEEWEEILEVWGTCEGCRLRDQVLRPDGVGGEWVCEVCFLGRQLDEAEERLCRMAREQAAFERVCGNLWPPRPAAPVAKIVPIVRKPEPVVVVPKEPEPDPFDDEAELPDPAPRAHYPVRWTPAVSPYDPEWRYVDYQGLRSEQRRAVDLEDDEACSASCADGLIEVMGESFFDSWERLTFVGDPDLQKFKNAHQKALYAEQGGVR